MNDDSEFAADADPSQGPSHDPGLPSVQKTRLPPALSVDQVDEAVKRAIRAWAAQARDRVDPFIDETFSFANAAKLHRNALGWDLVRAPANLALAVPALAQLTTGSVLRRFGKEEMANRVTRRPLMMETAVAREIVWLLHTNLLRLPISQGARRSEIDGIAEAVLMDPVIANALGPDWSALTAVAQDPKRRAKLESHFALYTGSRSAAADITTALASLGGGAAAFHSFTPSMLSLGHLVAGAITHHLAVASFPLGASVGGMWYGLFPASVSTAFTASVTGATLGAGALFAAFAGVFADPVQRKLGIHRKRLHRLIDAIEQSMIDGDGKFASRSPYVARLFDVMEALRTASQMAR